MQRFMGENVICDNGMPGYLALPPSTQPVPAVIVLHERYGFVQHPRDVADRFAASGLAGFAVNAFFKCDYQAGLADGSKRYYTTDPDLVDYMESALRLLGETGRVDMDRVVLLGMCQTGRHPLVMAARSHKIAAAICWYGAATNREFDTGPYFPEPIPVVLRQVTCPVLGLFAEHDNHIPVENVRRIRNALESAGKTFAIHVLDDCLHGFLNSTMEKRYHPKQAEVAWQLQSEFLGQVFSGAFKNGVAVQCYQAKFRQAQI